MLGWRGEGLWRSEVVDMQVSSSSSPGITLVYREGAKEEEVAGIILTSPSPFVDQKE